MKTRVGGKKAGGSHVWQKDFYHWGRYSLIFIGKILVPYGLLVGGLLFWSTRVEAGGGEAGDRHPFLTLWLTEVFFLHTIVSGLAFGVSFYVLAGSIRRTIVRFLRFSRVYRLEFVPTKDDSGQMKQMARQFNELLTSFNLRFRHIRWKARSLRRELRRAQKREGVEFYREIAALDEFLAKYSNGNNGGK